MNHKEEWCPVAGYEGFYLVSSHGRVMNVSKRAGTTPGKILKPATNKKGYLFVRLCKDGRPKNAKIHHLVATAFIGKRPTGYTVNHKDGNKNDNRTGNLEYATSEQNLTHSFRTLGNAGETNSTAKLKEWQVLRILELRQKYGYTHRQLSEMFGVDSSVIGKIVRRKIWKHIGETTPLQGDNVR